MFFVIQYNVVWDDKIHVKDDVKDEPPKSSKEPPKSSKESRLKKTTDHMEEETQVVTETLTKELKRRGNLYQKRDTLRKMVRVYQSTFYLFQLSYLSLM